MSGKWHGGKGDAKRPESEQGAFARGFDGIDWSATRASTPPPADAPPADDEPVDN